LGTDLNLDGDTLSESVESLVEEKTISEWPPL